MAHWIGTQGQLEFQNMPSLWRHQEKTAHPAQIIFFKRK